MVGITNKIQKVQAPFVPAGRRHWRRRQGMSSIRTWIRGEWINDDKWIDNFTIY